jgi:TRAP-type C4-dicarboxylate transport system permease small subunit
MNALVKIKGFVNRLMAAVSGVAIVALMAIATINVIGRLFGRPFLGTVEIVAYLGAIVVAFALGESHSRGDHIIVDIVTCKFPKALVRVIDVVRDLICLAFFAMVTVYVYKQGATIRASGEVSETLKIAYHPIIYAVAFGFAVLTLNYAIDTVLHLRPNSEESKA